MGNSPLLLGKASGKAKRDLATMPIAEPAILKQLDCEWQISGRQSSARLAALHLVQCHPVTLARCDDLSEVLGKLRLRPPEQYLVLTSMLEKALEHSALKRGLLQVLLPGIPGLAKRLDWGAPTFSSEECLSELIASLWEVIDLWAGQHRDFVAKDLLSAARLRCSRKIISLRPQARALPEQVADCLDPFAEVEWRLGSIAALKTLRNDQEARAAHLQGALGYSARETADLLGVSARTVQRWNRGWATVLFRNPVLG
ncbi:MAG: helix-turn-helix domain-containing protein [Actinobacteria bacterium]|nr:helix-turn-helix domain-containing protein [Actinomycetota bacterium]